MKVCRHILFYMVIMMSIIITRMGDTKDDQQTASSLQLRENLEDNTVTATVFSAILAVTSSKDNEGYCTTTLRSIQSMPIIQNSAAAAWTSKSTPSKELERSGTATTATPVSILAKVNQDGRTILAEDNQGGKTTQAEDNNQGGSTTHLPPVSTTPSYTDQDSGKEDKVWISIVVCVCLLLILLAICCLGWRRKKALKKRREEERRTMVLQPIGSTIGSQELDPVTPSYGKSLPNSNVHIDVMSMNARKDDVMTFAPDAVDYDHSQNVTSDKGAETPDVDTGDVLLWPHAPLAKSYGMGWSV